MCGIFEECGKAVNFMINGCLLLILLGVINGICIGLGGYILDASKHGWRHAVKQPYDVGTSFEFAGYVDAAIVGCMVALFLLYLLWALASKTCACVCDWMICDPLKRWFCVVCCPNSYRDPYQESLRRDVSLPVLVQDVV